MLMKDNKIHNNNMCFLINKQSANAFFGSRIYDKISFWHFTITKLKLQKLI